MTFWLGRGVRPARLRSGGVLDCDAQPHPKHAVKLQHATKAWASVCGGRPIRVFYAFDPRRTAILLIGGDKTGDDRFYDKYVPIADGLYDEHIEELRKAGFL